MDVFCDELTTRSQESYWVCLTVCGLVTSTMRQSRTDLGCSGTEKRFVRLHSNLKITHEKVQKFEIEKYEAFLMCNLLVSLIC